MKKIFSQLLALLSLSTTGMFSTFLAGPPDGTNSAPLRDLPDIRTVQGFLDAAEGCLRGQYINLDLAENNLKMADTINLDLLKPHTPEVELLLSRKARLWEEVTKRKSAK